MKTCIIHSQITWPVFPCHTPINGVCDCRGEDRCESVGKHPWTRNGLSDATTDELTDPSLVEERPIANIGARRPEGLRRRGRGWRARLSRARREGKRLLGTTAPCSRPGAAPTTSTGRASTSHSRSKLIPTRRAPTTASTCEGRAATSWRAQPARERPGLRMGVPLSDRVAPPGSKRSAGVGRHQVGRPCAGRFQAGAGRAVPTGSASGSSTAPPRSCGPPTCRSTWRSCWPSRRRRTAAAARSEGGRAQGPRGVRQASAECEPQDLPAGVTLLSHDSVMVEFETCRSCSPTWRSPAASCAPRWRCRTAPRACRRSPTPSAQPAVDVVPRPVPPRDRARPGQ
jgi:hypothetical protein